MTHTHTCVLGTKWLGFVNWSQPMRYTVCVMQAYAKQDRIKTTTQWNNLGQEKDSLCIFGCCWCGDLLTGEDKLSWLSMHLWIPCALHWIRLVLKMASFQCLSHLIHCCTLHDVCHFALELRQVRGKYSWLVSATQSIECVLVGLYHLPRCYIIPCLLEGSSRGLSFGQWVGTLRYIWRLSLYCLPCFFPC